MFETNYDPVRTKEEDEEEIRRLREEEQQALMLRQQQMMAQDMENGANAGTGTSANRPPEPEFKVTPAEDLSKYEAKITPQAPQALPSRYEAPGQTPQSMVQPAPQIEPVQQPMTNVQPMSPQQVMAQPVPGQQFQLGQQPGQQPTQQAPQMMPVQAPAQGPVNPMDQKPIWSDIRGQEVNNAGPNLPVLNQPGQPQAPVPPQAITPNTTPTPGTTSQQVAQDLENGPYAAMKTSKAYDVLGSDAPDKMELGKIAYGDYAPHFRLAAEQRLEELKKTVDVTQKGKDLIDGVQKGDPKAVRQFQRDISNPNPNEGSVGKLLLAGLLGNREAQTIELAKFGIGSTTHPYIGENGQEYMVTTDAKGRAISGISADGTPLSVNELSNIAGGNLKSARTTAIHAYDSEKGRLTKEREAWVSRGLTEDQLAQRGLGADQIEQKAQARYTDTLKMASSHGNIKRELGVGGAAGPMAGTPPVEKPKADVSGGHKGFDSSVARTMKFEGGYVENDSGRGPTNFGINQSANPDIDVKNLTADQAKKIYKEKYWNGVEGIDKLSPKSQDLIFDASVNQGTAYANNLLAEVGDNPEAIVARREADYRDLAARRPEKAKYLNGWIKRLEQEAAAPVTGGGKAPTTSILDNWAAPRKGEQPSEFDKRTATTAEEIDALATGLTDGSLVPSDLTGRDTNVRRYAMQRAKELDPTWSASDAISRRDALKKFTNPDSQVSKQLRAHITSANAIDDVETAFKALQNGNTPLFNQMRNSFREKTGSELPINAKTGAMLLGPEIIKSIIPGGGGVTERLEAQHLMGTNLSPAQQKGVFNVLKEFQGNALLGIENDWTKAKLPKEQFRERILGDAPAAQELLDYSRTHREEVQRIKKELKNPEPAGPSPSGARAELEKRKKEQK